VSLSRRQPSIGLVPPESAQRTNRSSIVGRRSDIPCGRLIFGQVRDLRIEMINKIKLMNIESTLLTDSHRSPLCFPGYENFTGSLRWETAP